jgi:hypothetical protein
MIKKDPSGSGCDERAKEMSGLQDGVKIMAVHTRTTTLCSPTSALEKEILSPLGEELELGNPSCFLTDSD